MKGKMKTSVLGIVGIFVTALSFISVNANAFDCYTDCGAVAHFTYPCPTFHNPHRRCDGREPNTFAVCQSAKVAACQILEPLEQGIIHDMVGAVSDNSQIQSEAGGWTRATCAASAIGIVTAVNAGYSAPICAAANVAAAGCETFVLSSSGVITAGVCSQLCADRRLSDCR